MDQRKKEKEIMDRIEELGRLKTAARQAEFECSTRARLARTQRQGYLAVQREAALWRKALNMVRRAVLQNLLEQEQQQYALELKQIGKASYQERK